MSIRAHLDEQFAREFGGLPRIDPPVNPYQPGLSVVDCSGVLTGNADIEINNWEAINGLCVEELPDGRHD